MQIYIEDYTGWCWNLCRYVDVHAGRYWSSSSLILMFIQLIGRLYRVKLNI